jgi:hypothetical protein
MSGYKTRIDVNREQAPQNNLDPRIGMVLRGLVMDTTVSVSPGVALDRDYLEQHLIWHDQANMAMLPTGEKNARGEHLGHFLVAHATQEDTEYVVPQLRFADRPEQYRTRKSNVYGTGLYVANRREAALRVDTAVQGRRMHAYLTDSIAPSEIVDRRRRFLHDVAHLVGMTISEKILPRVVGAHTTAEKAANRADARWAELGARLILLNEAPRGRIEKMQHEQAWDYATVPPQYALLRAPMLRIGSYAMPKEQPRTNGVIAMYGKLFWQAAARNGRDMRRFGIPWWR